MPHRFLVSAFVLMSISPAMWAGQDPPTVTPPGGYSGFPSIDAASGRFVAVAQGLNTLGVPGASFSVCIDPQGGTVTDLDLWLFDGDLGNPGNATATIASFWDIEYFSGGTPSNDDFVYRLYADPDQTGSTAIEYDLNGGDAGNALDASTLPDNDWVAAVNRPLVADTDALNSDGNYCYHFVAEFESPSGNNQSNRLMVASDASGNGTLRLLKGTSAGFVGLADIAPVACAVPGQLPCLFPGRDTTYDGTFDFNINVSGAGGVPCSLTLWEGDSDHAADTDHADTPNQVPAFTTSPPADPEGAHPGSPADNGGGGSAQKGGNVYIEVTGPGGLSDTIVNPSGTQEWEMRKYVSTDESCLPVPGDAQATATSLVGTTQVSWKDLDGDNQIFLLVEEGVVAAECSLDVEKTCEIIPLSTNDCRGKVFELVLEYVGGDCSGTTNDMGGNLNCTGDPGNSPVSISFPKDGATVMAIPDSGIVEGTKFTLVTTEDWFKGDLEIDVTGSGGTQSMSLHTSCSVPFLVGDQFGSLRLVGLSNSVAGTVILPEVGTECDYAPPIAPNCIGDPQSIVFFYRGGDCNETTNDQDGHLDCSGSDPGANVSVTITKDAAKVSAFPSSGINVGDFIVFQNSDGQLAATTEFDLTGDNGTQSLAIHTNCSKPLNLGDRFGALEVGTLAFDDGSILSLSTLVEYVYTVTNNMAAPVTGISLVDDVLGEIASGFTLASGESQMFTELSVLDTTTTNTAAASGSFGSVSCNGEASATVNVNPPPPTFDCSTPIDSLSMIWNGGPGAIRVKAWSAAPGSTLLADIDNVFAGDEVTVSGYAAYSGDVVWEIFVGGTETKLAQSVFNLSCSDEDMNDGSDCGKLQGDGKDGDGSFDVNALNFWIFTGLVDSDETFVCQLP